MVTCIHELKGWPQFRWDRTGIVELVAAIRHCQGRLIGRMEGLGLGLRTEATLCSLTEEVVKSREIEGELLDRDQVHSPLARRLGVEIGAPIPADRRAAPAIHSPLLISLPNRPFNQWRRWRRFKRYVVEHQRTSFSRRMARVSDPERHDEKGSYTSD
jgi:Fic family protein